jgi:hypothetical protein
MVDIGADDIIGVSVSSMAWKQSVMPGTKNNATGRAASSYIGIGINDSAHLTTVVCRGEQSSCRDWKTTSINTKRSKASDKP